MELKTREYSCFSGKDDLGFVEHVLLDVFYIIIIIISFAIVLLQETNTTVKRQ